MNLAHDILQSLDEKSVKLVKDLLKHGDNQVVDLGTHGWFRLFSAIKVTPRANAKKVIPLKTYKLGFALGHFKTDPVAQGKSAQDMANGTTRVLTKLGMKRHRAVVVVQDLSDIVNPNTGGSVGGFADFDRHGLSADTAMVLTKPKFAVELLAHEWGHAQWLLFSRAQKEFIRDWYRNNVVAGPKAKGQGMTPNSIDQVARIMWNSFTNSFQKSNGAGADEFMELARRVRAAPDAERDPWIFYGQAVHNTGKHGVGATLLGKMKKGAKSTDGIDYSESPTKDITVSLRKGEKISITSDGDDFQIWAKRTKAKQLLRLRDVPLDRLRDLVELDVAATEKENPGLSFQGAVFSAATLIRQAAGDPNAGDVTLEMVLGAYDPKEMGISNAFDVAISDGQQAVRAVLGSIPAEAGRKARLELFKRWKAAIRSKGFDLVPSEVFKPLIKEFMQFGWDLIDTGAKALSGANMAWFRDQAKNFGTTPSAYAASNDKELWADTVAYSATRRNEVPPAVRRMFNAVIQGKTTESRWIIEALQENLPSASVWA